MKVWIDMTAPAHPLVFGPIIRRLRAAGHEVEVTARDYAQTLDLLALHRIEHTAFGRPRRRVAPGQVRRSSSACARARRGKLRAKGRGFDLALAHGSNDLALAALPPEDPRREHVRLRVRHPAAQRRLPARPAA